MIRNACLLFEEGVFEGNSEKLGVFARAVTRFKDEFLWLGYGWDNLGFLALFVVFLCFF
jgi:hypothetical protein